MEHWVVDSGAHRHQCTNRTLYQTYQPLPDEWQNYVVGWDGTRLRIHGTGTVRLLLRRSARKNAAVHAFYLRDVAYVPDGYNLMSTTQLVRENKVFYSSRDSVLRDMGTRAAVAYAVVENNVPVVKPVAPESVPRRAIRRTVA
jgi:hypothetical protein